jgi:6-phosphogluconolactonase
MSVTRRGFLAAVGAAGVGSMALGRASAEPGGLVSTVYIGSFTDPGLAVGTVDDATGALTVGDPVDVAHASFLAYNADRTRLYTTNEQDDGGVTALDVTDPAKPVVLNRQSSRGSTPTHVSVHPAGYLLTANYGDGTVVVHRIAEDGSLGESTDLVQHQGTDREPHAHQILTDPSGQWVLAVDLGADSVYVYALDTDAGTLSQQQQLTLPTGAGPRHLAFHPNGTLAYVLGELRAEITVCAWADGQLTAGQVIPTVAPDAPGPNYPSEIAVSSDGRFVYAANRGENTIAAFSVAGDQLTHLGNTPCGGDWPRHFTLSPDETRVYVSNQNANSVDVLPRDPQSGQLGESVASTPLEAPGIVLF